MVGDAGVLPDAAPDVDAGSNCHGPGCDPVVALAMGAQRALAVTASGALWGWGNSASAALGDGVSSHAGCANCSALPVRALAAAGSPLAGVVAASVGFDFGCALIRDQTVQCWGRNYAGQRGDGHADDGILVPRQVVRDDGTGGTVILDHVTQIRSGDEFTCAVRDAAAGGVDAGVSASTEVWCWGAGAEGQLGTGAAVPYSNIALHATELGTHTISLAIAGTHVLALSSDGTILGIGDDSCGVVGSTTTSASRLTAGLGQVTGASEIATTLYHTCAITSPSTAPGLSCWGMASEALGSGSVPTMACPSCGRNCATMPFSLAQPSEPIEHLFGPSGGTFFGTTASGALYVWGGAFNEPFDSITVPTLVRVPPAIEAHVGGTAACALTRDGDVLCWGSNDQGQLGRGTITGVGMIDHTPNTVMW